MSSSLGLDFLTAANEETDYALQWINAIFPQDFETPLGEAMATFSTSLLGVGVLLLAWFTIRGAVDAAHEGKSLGNKWHIIWAPFRVALGIGLLVPIVNGFGVAQVLAYHIAIWGGKLATAIWIAASSAALVDGKPMPVPEHQVGSTLIENVAESLVCSASLAARSQYMMNTPAEADTHNPDRLIDGYGWHNIPDPEPAIQRTGSPFRKMLDDWQIDQDRYRNLKQELINEIGMAQTTLEEYYQKFIDQYDGLPDPSIENPSDQVIKNTILMEMYSDQVSKAYIATSATHHVWDFGPCGRIEFAISDKLGPAEKELFTAQVREISSVLSTLRSEALDPNGSLGGVVRLTEWKWTHSKLALGMVKAEHVPPEVVDTLDRLATTYNQRMFAHATKYVAHLDGERRKRLMENAERGGWLSAGMYYRTLSQASMMAHTFSNTSHTYHPPQYERIRMLEGRDSRAVETIEAARHAMELIRQAVNRDRTAVVTIKDFSSPDFASEMAEGKKNFLQKIGDQLTEIIGDWASKGSIAQGAGWLARETVEFAGLNQNADPITEMMELGHFLIGAASTLMIGLVGGGLFASSIIGDLVGLDGIFQITTIIVAPLAGFLALVGIALAYLLPMIPYIMILFLGLGWVTMFMESLIAMPIYAFQYIRMDGSELVDNPQKPGTLLLFNLFLRPALGVIAFFLAYFAIPPALWFLHQTFFMSFYAQQDGFLVGPIGFLFSILLYAYLCWQIFVRVFQLTAEMPDRVGRWFGVSAENLGEGRDTTAATMMVANMAHRSAVFGGQAVGKAVSKVAASKHAKRNAPSGSVREAKSGEGGA